MAKSFDKSGQMLIKTNVVPCENILMWHLFRADNTFRQTLNEGKVAVKKVILGQDQSTILTTGLVTPDDIRQAIKPQRREDSLQEDQETIKIQNMTPDKEDEKMETRKNMTNYIIKTQKT